jgi:hypothetical protein
VQEAAGLAMRRVSDRSRVPSQTGLVQVTRYWLYISCMGCIHAVAATANETRTDYALLPDLHRQIYIPGTKLS